MVSSMTPRDRRHPWWYLNFTVSKMWLRIMVLGYVLATIGVVGSIIQGPVRPLDVLLLVWVVYVGIALIASAIWRRRHNSKPGTLR